MLRSPAKALEENAAAANSLPNDRLDIKEGTRNRSYLSSIA